MKSIASIFFGLMLIVIVFYGVQVVGEESKDNTNIDTFSVDLINNFSNNLDNEFNINTSFVELESNLSINSTFDSQDVFAQEYLEGKSDSTSKTGLITKLSKIPDMIIISLGVPENSVIWIKSIIALIIGVILSFAGYRAIFGGGKITNT
jgi:hypothetical protein